MSNSYPIIEVYPYQQLTIPTEFLFNPLLNLADKAILGFLYGIYYNQKCENFYLLKSLISKFCGISSRQLNQILDKLMRGKWIRIEPKNFPKDAILINLTPMYLSTIYKLSTVCSHFIPLPYQNCSQKCSQNCNQKDLNSENSTESLDHSNIKEKKKINKKEKKVNLDLEFDKFWSLYPAKACKNNALLEFKKLDGVSEEFFTHLVNRLRLQITHRKKMINTNQWMPAWKNADRWLKEKSWEDEIVETVQKKTKFYEKLEVNLAKPEIVKKYMNNIREILNPIGVD